MQRDPADQERLEEQIENDRIPEVRMRIAPPDVKEAAIDIMNQLALLTRDDETYLWKIGGRGLDHAYHALRNALAAQTDDPPF